MANVAKIQTRYDLREDRLCLFVELEDGQRVATWLTRRMLIRMVPQLIQILTNSTERSASAQAASDPKTYASSVQRFNQKSAVDALKSKKKDKETTPDETADREEAEVSILVESIDVATVGKRLVLTFKDGQGMEQPVPFHEVSLRQWLAVLAANCRKARWTDDIWPAWLTEKADPAETQQMRLN